MRAELKTAHKETEGKYAMTSLFLKSAFLPLDRAPLFFVLWLRLSYWLNTELILELPFWWLTGAQQEGSCWELSDSPGWVVLGWMFSCLGNDDTWDWGNWLWLCTVQNSRTFKGQPDLLSFTRSHLYFGPICSYAYSAVSTEWNNWRLTI